VKAATTGLLVLSVGAVLSPWTRSRLVAVRRAGLQRAHDAASLAEITELSEGMARRLTVGATLLQALVGAAQGTRLQPEIEVVQGEHSKGVTLERAVGRWAARTGGQEPALLAATMRLATSEVGPRSELFDRLAISLRRRTALRLDALAKASQARLSGVVVGGMPWLVALVVLGVGGEPARFLIHDRFGRICLTLAVGLDVVGMTWMSRQIDRAAR